MDLTGMTCVATSDCCGIELLDSMYPFEKDAVLSNKTTALQEQYLDLHYLRVDGEPDQCSCGTYVYPVKWYAHTVSVKK